MNGAGTALKLGGFALTAAVLFAAAFGVGAAAGPAPDAAAAPAGGAPSGAPPGGHAQAEGAAVGHAPAGANAPAETAPQPVTATGLAVSQDGYTLETVSPQPVAGRSATFAFRIIGPTGAPVTRFTPTHDKPLHLVVARRDLSGFQHVHPTMDAGGTWRVPLAFSAGDHRIFADFAPDARTEAMTLGRDLAVPGTYRPAPLPAPARQVELPDGYRVSLEGDLVAGRAGPVAVSVRKDGRPVTDLQPYLAAYGHLVALREGDLGYLHVHPDGAPGDGRTPPGPRIGFTVEVPSAGAYRIFLQFQHDGVVRTAAFTVDASGTGNAAADPAPAPADGGAGGHGGTPGHGH